jgi:hypothetical protein
MKQVLSVLAWLPMAMSCAALATDGVIEINHAKVMASGGYPFVISQSGSYRLTSNLSQPGKTTDVIDITVSNVTLDLNGFAITGANACTYNAATPPTVTCSASASAFDGSNGSGINVYSATLQPANVVIRNGKVQGTGGPCVLAPGALVEDILAESCGRVLGIQAETARRVSVTRSAGTGIQAIYAVDSAALANGGVGIEADKEVASSRAEGNVGDGIKVLVGTVRNCKSYDNYGNGIVTNASLVTGNFISQNQLNGIAAGMANTSAIGNTILGNGRSADGALNNHGCGIQYSGLLTTALTTQNLLNSNGPATPTPTFKYCVCTGTAHELPGVAPNTNLCNGEAE